MKGDFYQKGSLEKLSAMLTPITRNVASIGCIVTPVTVPKEFHMISPPKLINKSKLQFKQLQFENSNCQKCI